MLEESSAHPLDLSRDLLHGGKMESWKVDCSHDETDFDLDSLYQIKGGGGLRVL